ncbi:hypothetical protein N867_18150, partial [Actinotalea fermentans ATCC 43279 = JCM 9966 = DSM 3133]
RQRRLCDGGRRRPAGPGQRPDDGGVGVALPAVGLGLCIARDVGVDIGGGIGIGVGIGVGIGGVVGGGLVGVGLAGFGLVGTGSVRSRLGVVLDLVVVLVIVEGEPPPRVGRRDGRGDDVAMHEALGTDQTGEDGVRARRT